MARPPKTIDDFILTRRTPAPTRDLGSANHVRPTLDMAIQPAKSSAKIQQTGVKSTTMPRKNLTSREAAARETPALSRHDIDEALSSATITPEAPPRESESRGHGRREPSERELRKRAKRDEKLREKLKSQKTPRRARKIVKRIFLILVLLIVVGVGYFVWKTTDVACKITGEKDCNVITVIGGIKKTTQLAADANGRTNVLIFGTSGYSMSESAWDGAFLTDSIMVLSVDQKTHDAFMVSLPRDLWVKHDCAALGTTAGKLNETFYCAYADGGDSETAGAAALEKQVGDILGLKIQYYVHPNWTALIKAVDAVGGVDVMIDSPDSRGVYDVLTQVKYPNGVAHLDGEAALALARARNDGGGYGLSGGNFDREMYQQKILAALQKKALSVGTLANPATVNALLDAVGDNLKTSFKTADITTLMGLAKNIKTADIKSLPLVSRPDDAPDLVNVGMVGAVSVVQPVAGLFDYSAIQAYLAQNLSSDPAIREAAVIDVLNGSATVGLAQAQADKLKSDGYSIGQIANAPANSDAAIQIYQLNSAKTATAAALAKKFATQIITGQLAGYTTNADFVIVFGDSFAAGTTETN